MQYYIILPSYHIMYNVQLKLTLTRNSTHTAKSEWRSIARLTCSSFQFVPPFILIYCKNDMFPCKHVLDVLIVE